MTSHPNIVILCADQLNARFLTSYGHPTVDTKNLSRLARDGVQLEACYCASPLCGPSRISFATSTAVGEHQHRDYGSTVDARVPNLVTALRAAGYRTAQYGKNHCFHQNQLSDIWDEFEECCLGNYDGVPGADRAWSAFPLPAEHPFNQTLHLAREGASFLERSAGQDEPFLLWINFQDPHPAFCCPPPYDTLFDPGAVELPPGWPWDHAAGEPARNAYWRQASAMDACGEAEIRRAIAVYQGQVRLVDDAVGVMLDAMDRLHLADHTVVLFFSDHGELIGQRRMVHKNPTFYDALTRIPVLIRWPGHLPENRRFGGLVEEGDLAPTLLDLAGVAIPPTFTGRSLQAALLDNADQFRETILVEAGLGAPTPRGNAPALTAPHAPVSHGPGAMVREGSWKLSLYHDDTGELFDLSADPHELHNRFDDPEAREIRHRLTEQLARRLLGVKVRHLTGPWPAQSYPADVRAAPLESGCGLAALPPPKPRTVRGKVRWTKKFLRAAG